MRVNLLALLLVFIFFTGYAQQIIPYNYFQYQKLNKSLYNLNTRYQTSIKPVINNDTELTSQLVRY